MILDALAPHAPALVTGVGVALLAGIAAARWIGPRGFMDMPHGRKGHDEPTPATAGIALVATIAVGYLLGFKRLQLQPEQWLGLFALAVVGILDDKYGLKARHKAIAGLLVAAMIALPGASQIVEAQPHLVLFGLVPLPPVWPLAFLLLVLLYWFVPQAMNLIDGANGLALGYALVVLGVLALAGRPLSYCAGTLLGLLLLNWPRAKHFLGDAGSLVLGLLLALEVKQSVGLLNPDLILWIFAYPILDVIQVVAIRLLNGRRLGVGDRNHLHHQWMDRFPKLRHLVVPGLWLQAGLCASAVVAEGWGWIFPVLGLSLLVGQVLVFVVQSLEAPAEVVEFRAVAVDEEDGGHTNPGDGFDAA